MEKPWLAIKDYVVVSNPQKNGTSVQLPRLLVHAQFVWLQFMGGSFVTCMSVFGCCSNIINLWTFLRMKPSDGVTVSLLCLSVSDLFYSIYSTMMGTSFLLFASELSSIASFKISIAVLTMFFGIMTQIFYTITILNTVFLAVSRYACVVRPLQFRNTFTVKLSVICFLSFAAFAILLYVPVLRVFRFPSLDSCSSCNKSDTGGRATRGRDSDDLNRFIDLVGHSIIPFSSQIVVCFCVTGMAISLRRSQKFRSGFQKNATEGDVEQEDGKSMGLSGKELRAMQQVVVISSIYLVCNLMKIGTFIAQSSVKQFAPQPSFQFGRLNKVMHTFRRGMEATNCSCNMFIYLVYNRKYVQLCPLPCIKSLKENNDST